jgi:molecular chaperone GrpE
MTHRKTRAEERIEELDVSPSALLEQNTALRAKLEELEIAAAEQLAGRQRALADYQNLKRSSDAEIATARQRAGDRLLGRIVDLVDDFDRALEHVPADADAAGWLEGIAAIDRKFRAVLEAEGVAPIEALGHPFDPALHDAIASVPGTGRPDGEVVAEMRRGYTVGDRVLRPSLVGVADGSESVPKD